MALIILTDKGRKTQTNLKYNNNKFINDKITYEDEKFILFIDGVVLNKKDLICKENDWVEYIKRLYETKGDLFFDTLKGSFYGFLFDKERCKLIAFTDHISSKPMYYYRGSNIFVFSNNYIELLDCLKRRNIKVSLNEQAALLLLTYGYVFEDITITNEIKRLMIGNAAIVECGELKLKQFYTLKNNPIQISEGEAIEEVDSRFRKAVELAFEKDKEYGYEHIAALSGGLDSRMTVWVANELGYTNQLNLTFSQTNYLDETVAKQIASDLKHEWFFKALDNGNFLKNINSITEITGGNVLYYGLAHGKSMTDYLNFEKLGMLHSGQLGDVVVSTYSSSLNENKQGVLGDGAYSKKYLNELSGLKLKGNYPNEEIFKMYIRGCYGINQGLLGVMQFSETYSPFYDIDFMSFCLSIPLKLRFDHNLYKKWILSKYPKAAEYIWEADKVPLNYPYWIKIRGRKIPLNQVFTRVAAKLGYHKYGLNSSQNMNPIGFWYRTNPELKSFVDKYYKENIYLLNSNKQLKSISEKLFFESEGIEKVQVLSLLSSIKRIIS